ncbi:hypothetical protein [Saccharothrix algeriensis]|uniref:Secreted protein n=1 Tax=Saccharothrix algeriensis TaxID=173560 RepID=A0A8T8HTW2_9PSEU|nr:hypothetical protein [Saccharothrix algeriensis]MBM7813255.1 hypothetical protein [Saccharothrix algeriensis]QTR01811.1 hypothetical protein J7S33_21340 [Saccharothrix algeriensis]
MSGAVAFVFGLCALSFAAGCVLTACMLRREPEPPEPEPVAERPEPPRLDLRWPPEDYATKPIHRNPVVGLPLSAPPAEQVRPALTLVPSPDAGDGEETAAGEDDRAGQEREDEVRLTADAHAGVEGCGAPAAEPPARRESEAPVEPAPVPPAPVDGAPAPPGADAEPPLRVLPAVPESAVAGSGAPDGSSPALSVLPAHPETGSPPVLSVLPEPGERADPPVEEESDPAPPVPWSGAGGPGHRLPRSSGTTGFRDG